MSEDESPCIGCKYHKKRGEDDPRKSMCRHPLSVKLMNIPGMINQIFNGLKVAPGDMRIIFVNEDEEIDPLEFPVIYDPRNVIACRARREGEYIGDEGGV